MVMEDIQLNGNYGVTNVSLAASRCNNGSGEDGLFFIEQFHPVTYVPKPVSKLI